MRFKPSLNLLLEFIRKVDSDFSPPLSDRVDIQRFANKLINYAEFFCVLDDHDRIGCLVALYANDYNSKYAYYPLVATLPSLRGRGFASNLMQESLDYLNGLSGNIKCAGIHTNNQIACHLYEKSGFNVLNNVNGRYYLEVTITD